MMASILLNGSVVRCRSYWRRRRGREEAEGEQVEAEEEGWKVEEEDAKEEEVKEGRPRL